MCLRELANLPGLPSFPPRSVQFWGLCLGAFLALSGQAQETAAVMPRNIFRLRTIGISGQTIQDRMNASGERIPLLSPLHRTVSAQDLAANNAEFKELYDKLNEFQPGLGDALIQSDLKTESSIDFKRTIYALEYGLTDKISLGFMVPLIEMNIHSNFQAVTRDQIAQVKNATQGVADELTQGLDRLAQEKPSTATFEEAIFTSKGYEVPGNYKYKGLSDIEAGIKYQLLNKDWTLLSLQANFRFPTTNHAIDYTKLLDVGIGDRQLDLGASLYWDLLPNPNLIFDTMVKWTSQRPDNIYRPVLRTWESDLPDLTDPDAWNTIRRDLGDMVETEVGGTYLFGDKAFNIYGVYQFTWKGQDKYSGSRSDLNYQSLELNTNMLAHRYEAGFGYSTIQHYFKKRFPVPFEVKYGYNATFKAKNSVMPSYHRFNLLLYF